MAAKKSVTIEIKQPAVMLTTIESAIRALKVEELKYDDVSVAQQMVEQDIRSLEFLTKKIEEQL